MIRIVTHSQGALWDSHGILEGVPRHPLHHRLGLPEARRPAFLLCPPVIGHILGQQEPQRLVGSL